MPKLNIKEARKLCEPGIGQAPVNGAEALRILPAALDRIEVAEKRISIYENYFHPDDLRQAEAAYEEKDDDN